ncbi:ribosome biogenesis protein [Candidatus Woesearchaeota archaeon]|nr:MAG: ribosome biogenesis protein [Candidatus Woesearchaeota archaeon]
MAACGSRVNHILKCQACGKHTMKEHCSCGGIAITTKPVRYTIDATTAKYRAMAKKEHLQKNGLL